MSLREELQLIISGEVVDDEISLNTYSEDKSIFRVRPQVVVYPKSEADIQALVRYVNGHSGLSLTARAAGTDMTGGPLSDSIVIDTTRHLNRILEITDQTVTLEPGVFYRDLERELAKEKRMLPSYPASKELCALGGMIANNAGGEKSLRYGKTEKYVLSLRVVVQTGEVYTIKRLNPSELEVKLTQADNEGGLYRSLVSLIKHNKDLALKAKPLVLKNSSGYNVWDLLLADGSFDLPKLFVGSQGTLGIITAATLSIVPQPASERLAVVFARSLDHLPEFIKKILVLQPTSLEVTDDHTFKLYLRYAREMAALLGVGGLFGTIKLFLPELIMTLRGGLPKLVILISFEGDNADSFESGCTRRSLVNDDSSESGCTRRSLVNAELENKLGQVKKISQDFRLPVRICRTDQEAEKYWRLRRDTYRLLREKITDRVAAPFIDDLIVSPEVVTDFLPKLYTILDQANLLYTISGHIGEGNFHIIPLVDLRSPTTKEMMQKIMRQVHALVLEYGGSFSAEHNDGLLRGPYLAEQFGPEVFKLFQEIKKIFDERDIFNPHKKVRANFDYSWSHLRAS